MPCQGERVLDLGCGLWGTPPPSTPRWIFARGPQAVLGIDSNAKDVDWLKQHIPGPSYRCLKIDSPAIVAALLEEFRPTVVKSDVEGAEAHLLAVDDELFASVVYYAIEAHSPALQQEALAKLAQCGFTVEAILTHAVERRVSVIFARNKAEGGGRRGEGPDSAPHTPCAVSGS